MYNVKKQNEVERQRRNIAKAVRSAVRLHFSMLGDDAINRVLPDILDQHSKALAAGEPFTLNLADLDLPRLTEGK